MVLNKMNQRESKKLRCINADNSKYLELGKIYTFDKNDTFENRVYVKEYKRFSFLWSRFEVIE